MQHAAEDMLRPPIVAAPCSMCRAAGAVQAFSKHHRVRATGIDAVVSRRDSHCQSRNIPVRSVRAVCMCVRMHASHIDDDMSQGSICVSSGCLAFAACLGAPFVRAAVAGWRPSGAMLQQARPGAARHWQQVRLARAICRVVCDVLVVTLIRPPRLWQASLQAELMLTQLMGRSPPPHLF